MFKSKYELCTEWFSAGDVGNYVKMRVRKDCNILSYDSVFILLVKKLGQAKNNF